MNQILKDYFRDKKVLVTGGTGSWGSGLVKQLIESYPSKELKIFSRGEHKEVAAGLKYSNVGYLKFIIGDVRDAGCVDSARKDIDVIFEKFEGYDERIKGGGEEYDLPERILTAGYKQSRINALIKHQEGHLTLWQTMKTKFYYGKTAGIYIQKQPENARKKIKIFRPAFFRQKKRLLTHPILTLTMFFMKFCEFGAGGVGYLVSRIKST